MISIRKYASRVRHFVIGPLLNQIEHSYRPPDAVSQLLLKLTYWSLASSGMRLPRLSEVGFQAYSQTDEDGILLFIFSIIGARNKKCVEICAGNGIECNTANLIINHGWAGLLVDGNSSLVQRGQKFYRRHKATYIYPPIFVCSWITRDNVNEVLQNNGYEGEIDLLSIDVDGLDYWLWDAIDVISPRVVVVEYQDIIGPEKAITVPYKDDFNAYEYPTTRGMPNFCGASLHAFVKLGREKGYRLVGCSRYGVNAFFMHGGLGEKELPST